MPLTRPLNEIYQFSTYGTAEDYENAFGAPPPAWDPKNQPKFWFDPNALNSPKKYITYTFVVLDDFGRPWRDKDGNPETVDLPLEKRIAAAINIPPNEANYPGHGQDPIQVPLDLSKLGPNEALRFNKAGILEIRDLKAYEEANDPGKFGPSDRKDLAFVKAGVEKLLKNFNIPV